MLLYTALHFGYYCSAFPALGWTERECCWCDAKLWREPTVTSLMLCNSLGDAFPTPHPLFKPTLCFPGAMFSNLCKSPTVSLSIEGIGHARRS
jgi:hypothetical protein